MWPHRAPGDTGLPSARVGSVRAPPAPGMSQCGPRWIAIGRPGDVALLAASLLLLLLWLLPSMVSPPMVVNRVVPCPVLGSIFVTR